MTDTIERVSNIFRNGSHSTTRDHTYINNVTLSEPPGGLNVDPIADKCLGVFLLVCLVLGSSANCLALYYFAFKQKCAALVSILYMLLCVLGVACCFMDTPVMVSLLVERRPALFNHSR